LSSVMTDEQRQIYTDRVELVLRNIRFCNSGCDVHTVGNIRQSGHFLLEYVKEQECSARLVNEMVLRLEAHCVELFKRKFHLL
jgi:hypothetical protein